MFVWFEHILAQSLRRESPTTPHISPALKPARRFYRPGGEGGGLEFGMLDVGLGIIGGGGGVGIWRR